MATGVYTAYKKDGTIYYRASITYKNKHISLSSFATEDEAAATYSEAAGILYNPASHWINTELHTTSYISHLHVPFEKYITLINFRDNGMYIKTPIYLCKKYFLYFLSPDKTLIFNTDNLFYYSTHRIIARGGYYYVNDFGMQTSILSRYGIRAHSVKGRDYIFKNGDSCDYRYENICVINRYNGVSLVEKDGKKLYRAAIHINGMYQLGTYESENEAAIAYNKAADMTENKTAIKYDRNYIENISSIQYASIYNKIILPSKFRKYLDAL